MANKKAIKYTQEFKESSAKLAIDSSDSITKVASSLGVSTSALSGWIKEYDLSIQNKSKKDDLFNQLKELKKENARLRQEREILKKAAAYFAKETQ